MKQRSILDLIFLFLIFGAHLRSLLLDLYLLRRLPRSANSARCCSAGSMPTNLRAELWRTWDGTVEIVGCWICCRRELGVIGRELIGVAGLCADSGDDAIWGSLDGLGIVAIRVRYGISNLVEEKFCRPSANRGVFGLSGEWALAAPTIDLPVNICCIPVRTFSNLDGGCLNDRVDGERLGLFCRTGGMALDVWSFVERRPTFQSPISWVPKL